jgi:hypothetical protein
MPNERIPDDPYRFGPDVDDLNRLSRFDRDGPLDRDFDRDPPSGSRITLFAVGIAIVLGAIFYGLNTMSLKNAPNTPSTQRAQSEPISPRAPPGIRDTAPPTPNSAPGTTTGAAPAQPAIPPATAPDNMSRSPPDKK